MRFLLEEVVIPGMLVAADDGAFAIRRAAENVWWVVSGDSRAVTDGDLVDPTLPPSAVLTNVVPRLSARPAPYSDGLTIAKVELDVCGAWMTVANVDEARPVVIRRAGWVDVRGHPSVVPRSGIPYDPVDDRIGLGPGDAVAFQRAVAMGDDLDAPEGEALLDHLLGVAGLPPAMIMRALTSHLPESVHGAATAVGVIGVPGDLGDDPRQRVADAVGAPPEELSTPGYPLGDLQPELWRRPPRPPRVARLRLSPDRSSPRALRDLLDRLLASWRVEDRVDRDGVRLAASELAANAVVHAGSPRSATIRYLGSVVRVEIDDESSVLPAPREADDRGGRGLPLVAAMSSAWGAQRRREGKRVWCEVAVRE